MIKLDKIKIYGFKTPNNNVEVQMSNQQATVIYGDNGCGKTTFLKIIHAVLSQDETILVSEEVHRVEINYCYTINEKNISEMISVTRIPFIESENNEVEMFDIDSGDECHYDWKELDNSYLSHSRSISLGVDRGSPSSRSTISRGLLYDFLSTRRRFRSNFSTPYQIQDFADQLSHFLSTRHRASRNKTVTDDNVDHVFIKEINMDNVGETLHARYRSARRDAARRVQSALFDTLALAIQDQTVTIVPIKEEIPEQFSNLIFKNRELIIEALDDSQENSFKDTIIHELNRINNIEDVSRLKENRLLSELLLKMADQLKDSEEELFAVNAVIDKFDTFTSDGKSLVINMDNITVSSKTGNHSINELSSGERHILTLFTLLLDKGRGRDFIIIDEPEISLNSKWQEVLLSTLSDILPNSQIIVASHSPIIAQSVDELAELTVE